MNERKQLQDWLLKEKYDFDNLVVNNPNLLPAEKQGEWTRFLERMQPMAYKLQVMDDFKARILATRKVQELEQVAALIQEGVA